MEISQNVSTPLSPRPRILKALLWAYILSALIGFADSAYLTLHHYVAVPLPCSLTSGCETVLTSPYSMVGPIPLAAFGIAFYLITFFTALTVYGAPVISRRMAQALFALGAIGLGISIIFESIQIFLIHAICIYCGLSALCSLLLCIFGFHFMRLSRTDSAA